MTGSAYTIELLRELIRINSINPSFGIGDTDESAIADFVRGRMAELGMSVEVLEATPGRPSVVGVLHGTGGGSSLMLYAHHDTVGVGAMDDPFTPATRDGRMFGRGSYDMKGGLAACLGAVHRLVEGGERLAGDLLVASVADEEDASLGMIEVLRSYRPDAAIVTEPTEMRIAIAHKGFAWVEIVTRGVAAHGSRPHLGTDANLAMARILAALGDTVEELGRRPPHPLVGPPSLHVGRVEGGTAPSVYAASARAVVERRTLPGESPDDALREVESAAARGITDGTPPTIQLLLSRHPFEARSDSPLLPALTDHAVRHGVDRRPVGVSYWSDAALLAAAGVDTLLLGPIGDGAHADVEWVDIDSVDRLASILADTATAYCRR